MRGVTRWRVSPGADPRAARDAWLRLSLELGEAAVRVAREELAGAPEDPRALDVAEGLFEAARLAAAVAGRENRRAAGRA